MKEVIIKAIAERIKEEQKKHERNIPDWYQIAARKIYATFDINPKQDTVGKEFYESADKVITVKRQETLNLDKLESKLDDALAKETKESLTDWLNSKRNKQETLEEAELAVLFHNTYERLAPSFGYETRGDTKLFDTTTPNGKLMIAVCKEIIKWQSERMYSEADKIMNFLDTEKHLGISDNKTIERIKWYFETYFEQFKKK